jgi:hypothetical protein
MPVRGLFASISMQKGKPFAPNDRMKTLLARAAEVGNATARALFWYERDKSDFLYEGSNWKRGFVGDSYEYLKDEGLGGRNLDARAQFFLMATFNSPAMVWKLIGKGSQYAWGYLDNNGDYLDGGKIYQLNLPKDPPAEKFMSVVVYDTQTRSQLQTSQPFPSKNNKRDKLITNDDGSIDLYFGPDAPAGKEANWIPRPFPGGAGFASCVSIARPKLGTTSLGDPVRSNFWRSKVQRMEIGAMVTRIRAVVQASR